MPEPGCRPLHAETRPSGSHASSPPILHERGSARLGHFWAIAPVASVYPATARIATLVWTIPLFLALAIGFIQPAAWSWPRVAAPVAIVGLTIVHTLYWTDMRMRAPIVPAIALVAVGASIRPVRR